MSSILEALRELEAGRPSTGPSAAWNGEPPPARPRWPIVGAMIVVALVAVAILVRDRHPATPVPAADVPADVAAPLAPAAPARPPAASLANEPPPRARVAPGAPALAVATAPDRPTPAPVSPPKGTEGDEAEHANAPTAMPGEPHVQLRSLVYSADPDERVVTLSINRGNPVTLHEGESAGGVDVGPIMRDRVYLRHAGNIFAVHARR